MVINNGLITQVRAALDEVSHDMDCPLVWEPDTVCTCTRPERQADHLVVALEEAISATMEGVNMDTVAGRQRGLTAFLSIIRNQ